MYKYCILTPTYAPHFKYVEKYLESYCKYVSDAREIPIFFILSNQNEVEEFERIRNKYSNFLDIHGLSFEDILNEYQVSITEDFLKKIGAYRHYSYQTLKKLYSILYIEAEYFLILDSESMWLRKTSMTQMFEDYFHAPFILGSDIKTRKKYSNFQKREDEGVASILNRPCEKSFVEHFAWFYSKQCIVDLCKEYGMPIDMVKKVYEDEIQNRGTAFGLMEWPLLHNYLYDNRDRYGYHYVDVDAEMDRFFDGKTKADYLNRFYSKYNGTCGLIEMALAIVDKRSWLPLAKLFSANKLWIIRCPETNIRLYRWQKKFLKKSETYIFAADQDHMFGINSTIANYMKIILLPAIKSCFRKTKELTKKIFKSISPTYRMQCYLYDEFKIYADNSTKMMRKIEGKINMLEKKVNALEKELDIRKK